MAISYPISLPTGISGIALRMINVTASSNSPFTGQQQVYQHQGQWWEADIKLPPMGRADAEAWIAAIASLSGQYGTFLLGDPAGVTPRGTVSACAINGASQTGLTLAVTMTGSLLVGDYIQVSDGTTARLHKVLVDQSGSGTLEIWPRLRESPVNSSAVVFTSAKGTFRLANNNPSFSWSPPIMSAIQFSIVEAI